MVKFFRFFAFFAVVSFAGFVAAQGTNVTLGGLQVDPSAAVEVTADSLTVDQETGSAVFAGNVLIRQGDVRIAAGQVEVIYGADTSQIDRLAATGGVTFVTATEAAEAAEADYNIAEGELVLRGNVLLTQGASAISAELMIVDLTTGAARMEGQVRTILQQSGN